MCSVDRRGPHRETQHIGVLGILVATPWRGRGIGRALIRYVVDGCRGKFELLTLTVFKSNVHAQELYRSLGFQTWGVLPKGILRDGRYTDVENMVLDLGPVKAK
ncbi:MAG: GNAT family N-acetyltransferase [Thermoplasmata archaeon]|nr:GNAT family N-acetyltransferase [Thermoplasmata archaeon]